MFLLGLAIQSAIKQGATRTQAHDLGHLIRGRHVREDPRSPVEVEGAGKAPEALGNMDAEIEVEAHLDVFASVDLPHLQTRYGCIGPPEAIEPG
jgi:hypothetical protein